MGRRKKNFDAKQFLQLFGIALGTYVVIKVVKAAAKKKPKSKTEKVGQAEQLVRAYWLKKDSALASVLYRMRWPDCPEKLDPQDPTHAACIEKWNRALADIEAARAKYPPNFYWLNKATFDGDGDAVWRWRGGGNRRIVLAYEQPISLNAVKEMVSQARQHPDLAFVLVEWISDDPSSMPYHIRSFYGPRIYDTVIQGSTKNASDLVADIRNHVTKLLKKLGRA